MMFNLPTHQYHPREGFTLIESLVAISILLLSIAGPLYAADRAMVAVGVARDQLTASYLAQEGIEYVRKMRDDAYLYEYSRSQTNLAWSDFITAVTTTAACDNSSVPSNACRLDPTLTPALAGCGGTCPSLNSDITTGIYKISSVNAQSSPFTRSIQVRAVNVNEEIATSTITWSYRGATYSVNSVDHLTPWQ